jgi:hypothetical protein
MSRFDGVGSIRRALSMPGGITQLDLKPDGADWQWCTSTPDRAREALACGLSAIATGKKVWLRLPDDKTSQVLEVIGLTADPDQD